MTNEARAKAVEAADLAFFRAFGLEAGSRSIAGKYAMRVAIDSYLATMAEAGWVMVPRHATEDMVTAAVSRPDYGASTTLFYGEIYRAMVEHATRGQTDEQG